MDTQPAENPKQEMSERRKLALLWILLSIASLFVIALCPPYDLSEQSTIMVKAETVINIQSARKTFKTWPQNQADHTFGYGEFGKKEATPVTFSLIQTAPDKKDKNIELATYDFVVRGEHSTVVIRFNPLEKPKKRFF